MASSFSTDGDCILVSHSSGYLGVIPKNRRGKIYLVVLILKSSMLLCNSYLSIYLSHSFHLTMVIQKGNFISLLQSQKNYKNKEQIKNIIKVSQLLWLAEGSGLGVCSRREHLRKMLLIERHTNTKWKHFPFTNQKDQKHTPKWK